jgi:hypothetical protein
MPSFSQDKAGGKVHGYVFGDYFYKLGGNAAELSTSQYSKVERDFQGFQFRRLYLYYEHNLSEKFFAQFLLEGNDKALEPGGRHGVFVKTAYLEWKELVPMGSLLFGLVPTPTWSLLSEKVWNYRSIEKTIIDYRGFGNASDLGVMLRGKFDKEGKFNYIAMIGNGNGQKPENNKYKKYYLSLSVKPLKDFVVEGYLDYEPAALEKNKTTLKGFAAYQSEKLAVGAEIFQQTQSKAGAAGANKVPWGLCLFAWAPIPGATGLNAFARYDIFDPDKEISASGFKESFLVFGLDYMPIGSVHIMPNLWVNSFSAKGVGEKDADVVGRISFFYIYK